VNALVAALLLVAATLLAAICSGAETGFYAFSRLRHRLELERGRRGAKRLERLFARPNRFLATLLLGVTLALELVTLCNHALLGSFASLSPSARATLGSLLAAPILFVLAEALPKQAFLARPYVLLERCSWILTALAWLLAPIAALIARLSAAIEEVVPGGERADAAAPSSSVEHALVAGLSEGLFTHGEHALARNVLELGRLTVGDLAVPLDVLPRLRRGARLQEWAAAMREQTQTRALVLDEHGEVAGMVHALDLALAISTDEAAVETTAVVRPLPRLDAALPVAAALGRLHQEGHPLALVVRGHGGSHGLLRARDVVAELFRHPAAAAPPPASGRAIPSARVND
jgi:CBS domain containing-hemolysin-like protein